jgi:dephospho-CoA kinase
VGLREQAVPALTVGLTGGLGAGKSAVLDELVALGAVGIDADQVARDVVLPGTPGFDAVVAAFGAGVVAPDGGLDRGRLGAVVFADAGERARLEAITHPLIRAETRRLIEAASSDAIVVVGVPLLAEKKLAGEYDVVVTVEASLGLRLERVLASRGMSDADARARIAVQASDQERAAIAWWVIDNDGTLAQLRAEVARLWAALLARRGDH